jgi:hypothetical protein
VFQRGRTARKAKIARSGRLTQTKKRAASEAAREARTLAGNRGGRGEYAP